MNSVNYLDFQNLATGITVTLSPNSPHFSSSLQELFDIAILYDGNPSYDPLLMIDMNFLSPNYPSLFFDHSGKLFKSHLLVKNLIENKCQEMDLDLDNWNRYWNMVYGSHRVNFPTLYANNVFFPLSDDPNNPQIWVNLRSSSQFIRIQNQNYHLILSLCESKQLLIDLELEETMKDHLNFAANLAFDHFILCMNHHLPIINNFLLTRFIDYFKCHNIFHPLINLSSFCIPPQRLQDYIEWQRFCRIIDSIQNPVSSQKLLEQLIHTKNPSALTNLRILQHEDHQLSASHDS